MITDEHDHSLPFTVPEGYFEQLSDRIMARLPEEEQKQTAVVRPIRRWVRWSVAASVVAAVLGIGIYTGFGNRQQEVSQTAQTVTTTKTSDDSQREVIEQVADYIMCDDYDMYAYISEE
jgi:predicted negative regulator of RcsB-dependent stress response